MNTKKTIFLVDDDPDALDQLSMILSSAGYETQTADSQQEGEQLFLNSQPDLAIVDLMMEHMDSGLVLCHYLKKLYPGTPVILLTAVVSETGVSLTPSTEEAQSWVKADMIMDKPARSEQILGAVHKLLHEPSEKAHAKEH